MQVEQNILLSVDAVVFGYDTENHVQVLLIKRKYPPFENHWALPGGFVLDNESLEEAVKRELQEETGASIDFMEQLYSFGQPGRDPRQRVVSIAYYALVKPNTLSLMADTDAADAQWFGMTNLPKDLAFDHQQIIDTALTRLRNKIQYEPIGFELLNEKFPFSDLEKLYTALLGRPIDRRNFKRKISSLKILDQLDEVVKRSPGRPATLFRFNKERYETLKREGTYFEV